MSDTLESPVPPAPSVPVSGSPEPQKPSLKRNWDWLRIILGAVVLLVAVIIMVVLVNAATSTPSKTLTAFCTDLKNSDYHAAYTQFSLGYQHQSSEKGFVGQWGSASTTLCTYSSVSDDGNRATATIRYQDAMGADETDDVTLFRGNDGSWKINSLQSQKQNIGA